MIAEASTAGIVLRTAVAAVLVTLVAAGVGAFIAVLGRAAYRKATAARPTTVPISMGRHRSVSIAGQKDDGHWIVVTDGLLEERVSAEDVEKLFARVQAQAHEHFGRVGKRHVDRSCQRRHLRTLEIL